MTADLPKSAAYDELRVEGGTLRPHWRAFIDQLSAISPEEYQRRLASSRAMIRDNGVTYNVYDDVGGQARPWQLDVMPFIISSADWAVIEAGILQRADLANKLLADIYGEQELIAGGHLPPHLVVGHPQYLRALRGIKPPGGAHMHLYSADLARQADGSWLVLSSRADSPSGIGYALENRIVVSQTFPDSFRDMQVSRLASFFRAYRESIMALAPQGRAVLLTPGPYNEAYFEHAYLSHYLGLSLVESDDLVVSDGQVFLKTLAGLERVTVIFRRVDSDYCDPLELRADSALGVPGLVEAAREGGVVIANALGGGVLESPSLDAYLPNICRAVLNEDLKIPDIGTIWCGTEWGRKAVLARMDGMLIRGAFDARPLFSRNSSARLGSELSAEARAEIIERITMRGSTLVAQDLAPLGMAPTFENGKLGTKPVSLRVFAAWTPDGYMVMPGGLARVAADENVRALTMQSGAASKDIWVLSDEPVDTFSLLKPAGDTIEIRRTADEAPSRAMDNLFWLGRYAERAENLVRVLRAVLLRLGDDTGLAAPAMSANLARRLLAPQTSIAELDESAGAGARLTLELQGLLFARNNPMGLQRLLANVERTAWTVRDRLSLDTWRTIHALTHADSLPLATSALDAAGARTYLDTLIQRAAALSGLSAENMTRSRNWLFMDLGRRIERAGNMSWLIRQTLTSDEQADGQRIQLALEIADSAMTYRSRYLNLFQAAPVLDLLLLDPSNPRSVAFQLATTANHIAELPRITLMQMRMLDTAIVSVTQKKIASANPNLLAARIETGKRQDLLAFLDILDSAIDKLSDAIADGYFQQGTRWRSGGTARQGGA
jgi:uncharacterized circularly permuted ATP-grasp superfamily protein/uncharacterized alpha-E superfamily protein